MRQTILGHYRFKPTAFAKSSYYLLLCDGARITVRSQQVRAMNLVWALGNDLSRGKKVAVIGGGAAGMTFAAAAAKVGANVHLFESSKLMHFQIGSWHRPLHPEIYAWPNNVAYRPVSHLPLLGWSSGTAHSVAREIVSKFQVVRRQVGNRLQLHERTRATIAGDGSVLAGDAVHSDFDIVVLAVGFGVERTPGDLPMNSYWRVDALDQTLLHESSIDPSVLVSGSGDGGMIEVLRACLEETEQGPFLDHILALTMDPDLRQAILEIEAQSGSEDVWNGYLALDDKLDGKHRLSLDALDAELLKRRRRIRVSWLHRGNNPCDTGSLPINRFLVSRLVIHKADVELELVPNVNEVEVKGPHKGKYLVTYHSDAAPAGERPKNTITCTQPVIRWGSSRSEGRGDERPLLKSVERVFAQPGSGVLDELRAHVNAKTHRDCQLPQGWDGDTEFLKRLLLAEPECPRLMASFVAGFDAPDWRRPGKRVYRIRIWLPDVAEHLTVRYDLHPEESRPISRTGVGADHEIWINTRNDYSIRARTSDGYEWKLGTVLEALNAYYVGESMKRIAVTQPDGSGEGVYESVAEAIACLGQQTGLGARENWPQLRFIAVVALLTAGCSLVAGIFKRASRPASS